MKRIIQYDFAVEYVRQDLELEVEEKLGIENFEFSVVEHESGNYLTITEEQLKDLQGRNLTEVQDEWIDEQVLEDATHELLTKLINKRIHKVVLSEEDRKVLFLG